MDPDFHEFLAGELKQIREQGLFKEEWPSSRAGAGDPRRGAGRARAQLLREQLLGLSSHPSC